MSVVLYNDMGLTGILLTVHGELKSIRLHYTLLKNIPQHVMEILGESKLTSLLQS